MDWTHEEHVIAFQLYNRISFGKIHIRNPEIIELAAILGRKVGSPSRKLANFARLDPFQQARGIKGLEQGAKGEEIVWKEFTKDPEALALKGEKLLADLLGKSLEEIAEIETDDLPKEGKERDAVIKIRVNQSFFVDGYYQLMIFAAASPGFPTGHFSRQAISCHGQKTRKTA